MLNKTDLTFISQAVQNSKQSFEEGNFPAGAVVVKDGEVLASTVSSPYPGLFHADSKAVTEAYNKIGLLNGATLYVGLEPCLMCIGVAYWSGIRRIVYTVPKSDVSGDYYETHSDTSTIINEFNDLIERIPAPQLKDEALSVIKSWEQKYLRK